MRPAIAGPGPCRPQPPATGPNNAGQAPQYLLQGQHIASADRIAGPIMITVAILFR
jgi:hypothetical protein|tara:strand:- start:7573 stop:7740 length:168 start_codon:yes stop_codon:yes gene_type:complete